MRDNRKKYLLYQSSNTGKFISYLMIKDHILYLEEGEVIEYEEPIPYYHLDNYNPNAKLSNISTFKLLPIVEYITLTFTISPTNEKA